MAKKKSGLGRGLSSLMGESLGEAGITPAYPTKPAEEASRQEEKKEGPEPAETPTTREGKPQASNPSLAAPAVVNKPDPKTTSQPVEASSPVPNPLPPVIKPDDGEAQKKPRPYIEEDDHIEIKSVVTRERVQKDDAEASIDDIYPNPDQPRTSFKAEEIEELAASIDKEGLLQPILVRKVGQKYQIIAGERRWQACKQLGLGKVPIRVKEATDDKAIELALIENIQRSDLNPIEEAYGYKRLMERKGMTQTEVAQAVSKGRSTIANALRLLDLPEDAQQLLYEEKITAGHARAILSVQTMSGRKKLAEKLVKEHLSVREAETLARLYNGQVKASAVKATAAPAPAYFKRAARTLRERLNTNVRIKQSKGKNKVEIEFKDEDDLRRLFQALVAERGDEPAEDAFDQAEGQGESA